MVNPKRRVLTIPSGRLEPHRLDTHVFYILSRKVVDGYLVSANWVALDLRDLPAVMG